MALGTRLSTYCCTCCCQLDLTRLSQSGQCTARDLGCSAPVQAGFVNPSVKRAPYIPYHAKHLPSGKDDPGKIPCGFAKEKKIFVYSPWLKKVLVGILTTLVS